MKDIYSPLEIDEEWDNYAPMADAAVMDRPVGGPTEGPTDASGLNTEGATTTTVLVTPDVMPKSRVMSGSESSNTGTKEPTVPDAAYNAAEALIDTPAADADPFTTPGFAASSGDTFDSNDTRGLVNITPGPTSGEATPETPPTDTPKEIKGIPIKLMDGEVDDSGVKLPEAVDESKGGTSSPDVPVISPFIAPVVPGEDPKEEIGEQTDEGDSDDVIDIGKVTPDTAKKSTDTIKASDDSGESIDDMAENSESDTTDDTDDTESDTAASSSETKADKPEAPSSTGDDELADIMDKWHKSNKEIANMLEEARKESEANVSRMRSEKTSLKAKLEQQISDLDEGIANEQARLAKIQTNLAKLSSDKDN